MTNYNNIFDDYITNNNLTLDNVTMKLEKIGYVSFFNDITTACLGQTSIIHPKKQNKTSKSLIYIPNNVKERVVMGFDMLYVSVFYIGIMTNGKMQFNYPNYEEFIINLVELRKNLKHDALNNTNNQLKIYLIKIYINSLYGMIENPNSVISSGLNSPREYIVNTSKNIIAIIASWYLNKSKPIYYIDTDSIFVPTMSPSEFSELKLYFNEKSNGLINFKISNLTIDENEKNVSAYIIDKKKWFKVHNNDGYFDIKGISLADNNAILIENKSFFGRNFENIFPEYNI